MNLDRALQTPGWVSEDEVRWLAEKASTKSCIAEIGSWRGKSTRAMADNTSATIYAVDTWDGTPDDGIQAAELAQLPHGLYEDFQKNLSGCTNVRPMRMTSLEAASKLSDLRFDMIFIDAAHDYESVKSDILAWRSLLAPNGLLCGHDFGGAEGVNRAVNELISMSKVDVGMIWYACDTL